MTDEADYGLAMQCADQGIGLYPTNARGASSYSALLAIKAERARTVAWLRASNFYMTHEEVADAIERGEVGE